MFSKGKQQFHFYSEIIVQIRYQLKKYIHVHVFFLKYMYMK